MQIRLVSNGIVLAGLVVELFAAGSAAAHPGVHDCRASAAALRESLEGVVEALIDGQPARLPLAERRVARYWSAHRREFPAGGGAPARFDSLHTAALHHANLQAASLAVRTAAASFEWCGGPESDSERLYILDLVGMTGWLRARGALLAWPPAHEACLQALVAKLERSGHAPLAARLKSAVESVTGVPPTDSALARASRVLLDLVDEVEKVLP